MDDLHFGWYLGEAKSETIQRSLYSNSTTPDFQLAFLRQEEVTSTGWTMFYFSELKKIFFSLSDEGMIGHL